MPIVVDYMNIAALGELAQESGYQLGRGQAAEAGRDRDMRRFIAQEQLSFERDQARIRSETARFVEQERTARAQSALASAETRREMDLQGALDRTTAQAAGATGLEQQRQAGRESLAAQKAGYDVERIREEARLGKYSTTRRREPAPFESGSDVPTKDFAQSQVNRGSHLIPAPRMGSTPATNAERFDEARQVAEQLAELPTGQLEDIRANTRDDDPMLPFLEFALQDRYKQQGGSIATDSQPMVNTLQGDQGLGAAHGMAPDPVLGGMGNAEFEQWLNGLGG